MEDLKFYQDKMDKTMEVLIADYGTIRAGRANPHVLDKIKVDYYGTPTPLQQVGNVSVPEARMIVIQPWEKSLLNFSQGWITIIRASVTDTFPTC